MHEVFWAAPAACQRSSLGRCGAAPGIRAVGREAGARAHACPCTPGIGPAPEVACSGFAAVHASIVYFMSVSICVNLIYI